MMTAASFMSNRQILGIPAYQVNNRALDLVTVKHASPKGVYLVPVPGDNSRWEGVLFVREGPYAPGVFRFHISFPVQYPQRPPNISFSTEIFHPLITPLTTYTYTTQDTGTDTISASDDERLPPGGLSLRHGFPQWFNHNTPANAGFELRQKSVSSDRPAVTNPPHILDVLYYMRSALMSEDFLNSIRLDAAANPNAWHAWQSYREKGPRSGSLSLQGGRTSLDDQDHSRQQPGGARKPGEWNWHGVWEDRVRKGVQFSVSENALFGKNLNQDDLISFFKMDSEPQKAGVK